MHRHHIVLRIDQMDLERQPPPWVDNTTTTNTTLATHMAQKHNTEVHQDEQRCQGSLSSATCKLDGTHG